MSTSTAALLAAKRRLEDEKKRQSTSSSSSSNAGSSSSLDKRQRQVEDLDKENGPPRPQLPTALNAPREPSELFEYCKTLIAQGQSQSQQALKHLRVALRERPDSLDLSIYAVFIFHQCRLHQHAHRAMAHALSVRDGLEASLVTPQQEQMLVQAQQLVSPFENLPVEIIERIFHYIHDDLEHQYHPYVLLELNWPMRLMALRTNSLWTRIAWSPEWQASQPPAATADAARACAKMIDFFARHSADGSGIARLTKIDLRHAPELSCEFAPRIASVLRESQDTLSVIRLSALFSVPDPEAAARDPTLLQVTSTGPVRALRHSWLHCPTQTVLDDIATESCCIEEMELATADGHTVRSTERKRTQRAPSLKRLIWVVCKPVRTRYIERPERPEWLDQPERPSAPINPLLQGLQSLEVRVCNGVHTIALFRIAGATLEDVACYGRNMCTPDSLSFINPVRDHNMPHPSEVLPLVPLPVCRRLRLSESVLMQVSAPLCVEATVLALYPAMDDFSHHIPSVRKLTICTKHVEPDAPAASSSLEKLFNILAPRSRDSPAPAPTPSDARVVTQTPMAAMLMSGQLQFIHEFLAMRNGQPAPAPVTPNIEPAPPSGFDHLEELHLITTHPDAEPDVSDSASLNRSRDLYEQRAHKMGREILTFVQSRIPRRNASSATPNQTATKATAQTSAFSRHSTRANAPPAVQSPPSESADAPMTCVPLRRLHISEFYLDVGLYRALRRLCDDADVQLDVFPDPEEMAKKPYMMDVTGHTRGKKHSRRTLPN